MFNAVESFGGVENGTTGQVRGVGRPEAWAGDNSACIEHFDPASGWELGAAFGGRRGSEDGGKHRGVNKEEVERKRESRVNKEEEREKESRDEWGERESPKFPSKRNLRAGASAGTAVPRAVRGRRQEIWTYRPLLVRGSLWPSSCDAQEVKTSAFWGGMRQAHLGSLARGASERGNSCQCPVNGKRERQGDVYDASAFLKMSEGTAPEMVVSGYTLSFDVFGLMNNWYIFFCGFLRSRSNACITRVWARRSASRGGYRRRLTVQRRRGEGARFDDSGRDGVHGEVGVEDGGSASGLRIRGRLRAAKGHCVTLFLQAAPGEVLTSEAYREIDGHGRMRIALNGLVFGDAERKGAGMSSFGEGEDLERSWRRYGDEQWQEAGVLAKRVASAPGRERRWREKPKRRRRGAPPPLPMRERRRRRRGTPAAVTTGGIEESFRGHINVEAGGWDVFGSCQEAAGRILGRKGFY
ncbi:hypothetical protein DFH09DRAFT_1108875 [Mycena vulgaris]|nr:hypothetical protein DFH09DRAFT_1108875 [Mycena vulgaris]